MSVKVNLPAIMRQLVENQRTVAAEGGTVAEVLDHMESRYPGLKERLTRNGNLLGYINVFRNDDDVRFIDGLNTSVATGDELTILPAVAGG